MKREDSGSASGSGSISQRLGSADPDPHQNVIDPEHCLKAVLWILIRIRIGLDLDPGGQKCPRKIGDSY
jgi:hypothetical protein